MKLTGSKRAEISCKLELFYQSFIKILPQDYEEFFWQRAEERGLKGDEAVKQLLRRMLPQAINLQFNDFNIWENPLDF